MTSTEQPATQTTRPTQQVSSSDTLTDSINASALGKSTAEPISGEMTTNTVIDIIDNTIPDDTAGEATEQVTSMETDTEGSTVPDSEVLTGSMSGISVGRARLSTPLPLTYNLSSLFPSENSTSESSNRTRRSIEGKAFYLFLDFFFLPSCCDALNCLHSARRLFRVSDIGGGTWQTRYYTERCGLFTQPTKFTS
jgi:hypothetical protein